MKAAIPPAFWASAMACSVRVVFPDDSGPKISITLPRGYPPTPRAISSPKEPDGITSIVSSTALSPSFITVPFP